MTTSIAADISKIAHSRLMLSLFIFTQFALSIAEEYLSTPRLLSLVVTALLTFGAVVMVKRIAKGLGRSTAKQWTWVAFFIFPFTSLITLLILLLLSERAVARSPYRISFFTGRLLQRDA